MGFFAACGPVGPDGCLVGDVSGGSLGAANRGGGEDDDVRTLEAADDDSLARANALLVSWNQGSLVMLGSRSMYSGDIGSISR